MAITVGASTITMNSGSVLQGPLGSAPSYLCRAWVNFNGTGTVVIRASGNVSSVTDNGVGDYTVNFATAMPDANYSMASALDCFIGFEGGVVSYNPNTISANVVRLYTGVPGTSGLQQLIVRDPAYVFVSIFR